MRLRAIVACLAGSLTVALGAPASAATGTAWDSVTRFSMGESGTPQPGNFAQDFQAASQPLPAPSQRGGMFGALSAAMGAGGAMMQMMQNGFAERHYVAGNLRRRDNLAMQTASIVDCTSHTVTVLNLAKKTYHVDSLDAPRPPERPARGAPPGDPMQDDGSKMSFKLATTALGPKTIENVPTAGYQSTITMTMTRPSGESHSFDATTTAYYSSYPVVSESCATGNPIAGMVVPGAPPMPIMSMYQGMMKELRMPGSDPRISVSASGPTPPVGKLEMFLAIQSQAHGPGFAMTTENANVRQITDADKAIFGVPPDFTKEN